MASNKSNKYSEDMKRVRSGHLIKVATVGATLAIVVVTCLGYALLNEKLDFGKCQKIKAQSLTEIGPRIKYVLQHSTPGVIWLMFCVFYVISKRVGSPALNPTLGYEHLTESAKNIFLNSLEQFLLSFVSQLILITYLEPKLIINVIPVLNLLWITGRIFFWLGYPKYRTFGIFLNLLPLTSTLGYISYKYVKLFNN